MKKKLKDNIIIFLIFSIFCACIYTANPATVLAANVENPAIGSLAPLAANTAISDIFPDAAMANMIAGELNIGVNDIVTAADLEQITVLSISNNPDIQSVTGIKYLRNLAELYLENNRKMPDLPGEVGYLSNLTKVVFWHMPFKTLPGSVGYWSNLQTISLWGCDTETLPPQIGNWTKLTYINCDGSYQAAGRTRGFLKSIPEEISYLTLLNEAQFENNRLTSLPQGMASLSSSLTRLDISNNMLIEKLPALSDIANLNTSNQVSRYKEYTAVLGSEISADQFIPPILLQQKNDYNKGTLSAQGEWTVTKPDSTKVTVAGGNGSELSNVFNMAGNYSVVFHVSNGNAARLDNSAFTVPVKVTSGVPLTGDKPTLFIPLLLICIALLIIFIIYRSRRKP